MNNNRAAVTSTVGYMCLALTAWMLSMPAAGWFAEKGYMHGEMMAFPLAIVLAIMGILAFMQGRSLDAIIFFGGAGLFWTEHLLMVAMQGGQAMDPGSYTGWFYFIWAVFFAYVWVGSFKAGIVRMLFLLGLWLTLLALAIAGWFGLTGFWMLGGYLGLITAILAAIVSAMAVISHGFAGDPNSAG